MITNYGQSQVASIAQQRRMWRRPQHTWNIRTRPFLLVPMVLAPVLPGETLKSALFQIRAVSDPIRNPLIGWWYETYWFYVKHRDLAGREDFTAMMLDPNKDMSGYDAATDAKFNHLNSTESPAINWTKLCLTEVVEWYFRNEGESYATAELDGYPVVRINNIGSWDSAILESDLHADDVALIDAATSDVLMASEVEAAMRTYEMLKAQNLVSMTYEDFLRSYGIRVTEEEQHKPELIRYTRDFQYPTNTVEPTTGTPTSALSWSVRESISKDRLFKEPGFILGCTCVRPKIYLQNYGGSLTAWMNSAQAWLPAVMSEDPRTSMKKFAASDGPLNSTSAAYWIDIKDLFMYGEQFTNFDAATTDQVINGLALPTADLADMTDKLYPPDLTALRSFFADFADTAGYMTESNVVRSDGVVNFNILGRLSDTSPNFVGSQNV